MRSSIQQLGAIFFGTIFREGQLTTRDKSRDGWINRLEAHFMSHYPGFWNLVMSAPPLQRAANHIIIDRACNRTRTRPHPLSSMPEGADSGDEGIGGYTSWESLTDQRWFARHLPPRDIDGLPSADELKPLFAARAQPVLSDISTLLFPSFAQWFTDGFLMTSVEDRRRTHTSHQLDFNPLYGLTRDETLAVRECSEERGRRGRLKCWTDDEGEVFAPLLFDENGAVKTEFAKLRPPLRLDHHIERLAASDPTAAAALQRTIFAFAGERANTTPYTAMLNTLFLREHNRLAGELERRNPSWTDERVFQTARNINCVLLIKIVVEEYINHISPYHFQITADPSVCWRARWNKPNWIAIEFNLLYRWHSLIPDQFDVGDRKMSLPSLLYNGKPLLEMGLAGLIASCAQQRAWKLGLMNTADVLVDVELATIKQERQNHIGSYNDYREAFGFPTLTKFDQLSSDPLVICELERLYKTIDRLEFFVGLLAEDVAPGAALPPLLGRMVGVDAFSQALTNPLLSEHVFNERTFTDFGMSVIAETTSLQSVMNRNLTPNQAPVAIAMTL